MGKSRSWLFSLNQSSTCMRFLTRRWWMRSFNEGTPFIHSRHKSGTGDDASRQSQYIEHGDERRQPQAHGEPQYFPKIGFRNVYASLKGEFVMVKGIVEHVKGHNKDPNKGRHHTHPRYEGR